MKKTQLGWKLFKKKPRTTRKHRDAVVPLPEYDVREKGEVAYLQAKDNSQMQKLMSIGILPGMSIRLEQKFPSYVIALGQAYFAVDKELASAIYVRAVHPHKQIREKGIG